MFYFVSIFDQSLLYDPKNQINSYIYNHIIVCAIVFITSCKKQENSIGLGKLLDPQDLVSTTGITIEDNYLHFSNLSIFFSTMEALDTVSHEEMNIFEGNFSGYQSMRSYYNDLEDALNPDTFLCPNDDESLSAVLSVEGIVRIDSVAYLLDYATNSVYEVYPVNSATIDSLKLKNEINNESMYVFKYSMDDEIFYPDSMISAPRLVMEDGRIMPSNNTKRAFRFLKKWWHTITGGTWGCSDNAADAKKEKDKHFYTDNNFECKKYRYKYKIKYQKSGIRFALIVKCRHYKDQDGSCSNENYQKDPGLVQFEGDFSGKVFCGNNKSEAHSVLYTNSLNNNLTSTPYKSYFYKSGSKLAKYILRGQFWLQEMDDLSSFPFIINQSCNPLNTPNNCFEIKSNWP